MSAHLADLFRGVTAREAITSAVDVLVVYYVIYRALLLVKGTRGAQMLIGVGLFGGGFYLARMFELNTLLWLLDNLINYSIIFLIVIFQQDIRRALTRVGGSLFASERRYEETFVFEEVIKAAERLAHARRGALVVLEREADLDEFFSGSGEVIDGRVTEELLVALFVAVPENTVHDGAAVIRNLRLHRAGCVLPLSANRKLDKSLGTRHRAAIGITEETDAVVVVVSEERGTVSLCFGGNIAQDLDTPTLRKALLGLFQKEKRPQGRGARGARPSQAQKAAREATQKLSRPVPLEQASLEVTAPPGASAPVTVSVAVAIGEPAAGLEAAVPGAPSVDDPPASFPTGKN